MEIHQTDSIETARRPPMRRPAYLILISFWLLQGLPFQAVAGEMTSEELYFLNVPTVFSATKMDSKVNRVPNKVIIISEQDIRRRNYRYLNDIFRDLPGFMKIDFTTQEFG